jgi:hypothetical protein
VGMQMTLYELGKHAVRDSGMVPSFLPVPIVNMLIGACSGVVAQTIFYPGDTVRYVSMVC